MLTWVLYDISEDKHRTKAAQCCQQAGLYRVQKSVFLGDLNKNQIDQLTLQLEEQMDTDSDSIYIFPMCRPDFDQARLLGQAFDQSLVTNELNAMLL